MPAVLSVKELEKSYGSIKAVDNISFSVDRGEVCGILGPNGSGKTTTLSVLMGAIEPQKGSFTWMLPSGENHHPNLKIGALIESPNFYPYLSLSRNLQIHTYIKGVPATEAERVLKITGLYERRNSKYQTLSLGMKQRMGIAVTLLGDPDILVLDEPANGLDPQGIADIREIIRNEAVQGKTIILASHILDEVEKVCSHVVILKKGKVIGAGSVGDLLSRSEQMVVRCSSPDALIPLLEKEPGVTRVHREKEDLVLQVDETVSAEQINRLAFEHGIVLSRLVRHQRTLESQFLELVNELDR